MMTSKIASRNIIMWFGIIGAVLFTVAFITTFSSQKTIELFAHKIVQYELEKIVGKGLPSLNNGEVEEALKRFSAIPTNKAIEYREIIHRIVEAQVQFANDPNCHCNPDDWKFIGIIGNKAINYIDTIIPKFKTFKENLVEFVRYKYQETLESFMLEFRIFTGANVTIFATIGMIAFYRKDAGPQLIIPTLILITAGGVVGVFYIFNQDWLSTIIFNEYTGYGYFTYIGVIVVLLSDIIYNKGRICNASLKILEGILNIMPFQM